MRFSKEEVLLAVAAMHGVLFPVLVDLDLGFVRDVKRAGVLASAVINVYHQVSHLAGDEEVFSHCHIHCCSLTADEANLFREGHNDVELRIVDNRAHRADMDALPVTNLRLAPLVVDKIGADGHDLRLEEPSKLGTHLSPALRKVERLGHVGGDLKGEWHLSVAGWANVAGEAVEENCLFPRAQLHFVLISLALVTMVNLFTCIDELEL